jgi:hypothetical protein
VPFEILGMVGDVMHIKDKSFRMVPNPTVFHWDMTEFSLIILLEEYGYFLSDLPLATR